MEMKHLLILAMASGLTACAGMGPPVEHTVQSVETTLPKVWYAPPLPHQGQTASMTDWWARLGDAQLPALIADAQRGSASIMTARAQVFAARAALAGADSATLPQVALEAGAYRGVSASAPLGTGMNAGLQASWALDVWGQNASSVRQASAQANAAQAGWHEARVLMAAETARLYLGWRSCLAQKAVIDSDRASRSITAQSAADTERAGLLAPATAALARAGQADAEARLAQQHRQCEQQFKAIVALVGADEPALRERLGASGALPDPTAAGSALAVSAVPLEVIRQRPDVARAQQELVAAAEGVGVARAALWPSLSLSSSPPRRKRMPSMTLRVLLPFEVFAHEQGVTSIVVETAQGSFGLLPQRLDCVAALVPGILSFETESQGEVFLAVDEGVLVKIGPSVVISARRALRGDDLSRLRDAVEQDFLTLDAQEEAMRTAMDRLETGFMRRFASLRDRPS